jgi:phospholipid/cholesterol/gamma-HCH transport system substrate-binding protein
LPESMSDQTRTGTYGSWYNYYLCGFSGNIKLPVISNTPGLKQLQAELNHLSFKSRASRCHTS